jgi:hypothetical protein
MFYAKYVFHIRIPTGEICDLYGSENSARLPILLNETVKESAEAISLKKKGPCPTF